MPKHYRPNHKHEFFAGRITQRDKRRAARDEHDVTLARLRAVTLDRVPAYDPNHTHSTISAPVMRREKLS